MQKTVLLNGSLAESLINFRGELIKRLVARGHQVHVTAPEIDKAITAGLRDIGAVAHSVPLARQKTGVFADVRYCRSLMRVIDDCGADYVINYTVKPNIWGGIAAGLKGVPSASMVTGLGFSFIPGKGLRRGLAQRIARVLYRAASSMNDVVIFQNRDDLADFTAAGCLANPDKAKLVDGSGVDVDHFAPRPLPPTPVFLMVSRYLKTKGLCEYAAASLELKAKHPGWRFHLAGYPDFGPDGFPESQVAEWNEGGLEILGHFVDVRRAIAESSIYVLPSYREGTPRSVLEAMAMGRPVITTDAPGCRETVRHGENGLLVPVADAAALRDAMEALGRDADMRRRMGQEGRRIAENRYEVGRVTDRLIGFFNL